MQFLNIPQSNGETSINVDRISHIVWRREGCNIVMEGGTLFQVRGDTGFIEKGLGLVRPDINVIIDKKKNEEEKENT